MRQKLSIKEILALKATHPTWEPDGPNKETWEEFLRSQNAITKKAKKIKQDLKPTEVGQIDFSEISPITEATIEQKTETTISESF